jgi:spore cortex biosynthesis protein YabQ
MFRNTLNQWAVLYYSVFAGILTGLLYDVLRMFRRAARAKRVLTALTDIVFWAITGGLVFFTLWQVNGGQPQWFAFASAAIGACIYLMYISPSINMLFQAIKKRLRKITNYFFSIVKKKKM